MFRDPLLRRFQSVTARDRGRTLAQRLGLVGAVAGVAVLLTLVVVLRLLPRDGLGYPLYWLHDYIYLPIKGYTVTRRFPYSLVGWGTAGLLFAAWLASVVIFFLTGRSPLQDLYSALARHAVRQPVTHGAIIVGTRLLRHFRLRSTVLLAFVEQERARALLALSPRAWSCRRLRQITDLWLGLFLMSASKPADWVRAAAEWSQAFLAARIYDDEDSAWELARSVWRVAMPLLPTGIIQMPPLFGPLAAALDVLSIAYAIDPEVPARAPGSVMASHVDISPASLAPDRLVSRIEARRATITQLVLLLERSLRRTWKDRDWAELSSLDIGQSEPDRKVLPHIGRILVDTALAAAVGQKSPDLALGTIEYLDALALAVAAIPPGSPHNNEQAVEAARQIVVDAPRPGHYQAAAILVQARLDEWQRRFVEAQRGHLAPSAGRAGIGLAKMHAEWWQVASGPGPDPDTTSPELRVNP